MYREPQPHTIDQHDDRTIRGHIDANSGWTFEIAADRSPGERPLPTAAQLEALLNAVDP